MKIKIVFINNSFLETTVSSNFFDNDFSKDILEINDGNGNIHTVILLKNVITIQRVET